MNKFERAAHDVKPRVARPSWEHTVETYTGNREKFTLEHAVIIVVGIAVAILIVEHTGLVDKFINSFG